MAKQQSENQDNILKILYCLNIILLELLSIYKFNDNNFNKQITKFRSKKIIIVSMCENIQVAVRCRPLLANEITNNEYTIWEYSDNSTIFLNCQRYEELK